MAPGLFAEDAAEDALRRAEETTSRATLEGDDEVVEVYVSVSVLVFDDVAEAAHHKGNESKEGASG